MLLALGARAAAGQSTDGACSGVRPPSGSIGLLRLECVGRSCSVNDHDARGYFHSFAGEPRIGALSSEAGPARELRVGDIIVAIDSVPITTRDGGRRLASLEAGRNVRLLLRRDGRSFEVQLTPVPGCNTPALTVDIP